MRNELERTITQAPPMRDGHPGVYGEIAGYYDAFLCEDAWLQKTNGYHSPVEGIYRAMVPPGERVLEIGCGRGDLLAALRPARGVGVDVSRGMLAAARRRHPELTFVNDAGEDLRLDETSNYIILADLVPTCSR